MTLTGIANDLVAMCKVGDFHTLGKKYCADDMASIEACGPPGADTASHSKAPAAAKRERRTNADTMTAPKSKDPT